jgi:ribosomal protein L37AE/L43A
MNCPSCGTALVYVKEFGVWICTFCDANFSKDKDTSFQRSRFDD